MKRNPPLIITLSLRDGRPFSVADALNGTYDSETILIAWDAKGPAAERPSKDEKDKDKVKDKDKGKGKGDGAEVLDLIDVSEVGEGLARGEDVTFRYDPKALARGPEPSIVEFLEAAPQSLPREETLPLVGSASGARILFAHVREGVLHVLVEMRPSEGAPCSPPDLALSFRDMKSGAAPAVEWRQLKERRRGMRGDTGGPPDASSRRFEAVPLTRDASCAEGGSFHLATAILAPVG